MANVEQLKNILSRIDGRGYKAYKDIQGSYEFDDFELFIDYVQGDPFATPSKIRVRVDKERNMIPSTLFSNHIRRIAMEDYLAREMTKAIFQITQKRRGTGKSGLVSVDAGRQEVLQRTAVVLDTRWVEARLQVGLPARGRRVLGRQAEEMLTREIPKVVEQGLRWVNIAQTEAHGFVECIENQEHIRCKLDSLGLVAFIGNGSILPRQTGASDLPLSNKEAVAFTSSESQEITLELPNPIHGSDGQSKSITGMGIPKGVTLIVGGGYHGKSTFLRALERGVYLHIPGDGREYVVTCRDAVKIRAEDGRRVENVDISPFISNLPYKRSTKSFSTDDASGSTSQAANIVEALEVGASVLLLDEDTSATNFMVRDARMQALVHKEHEPITPFLDRVRELYETYDVSTILVMGGSGDYFDVADYVIMMKDFLPYDVTSEAKKVAESFATKRQIETTFSIPGQSHRIPLSDSFDPSRGKRSVKIQAKSLDHIAFGRDSIDMRYVEQLVDFSQVRAVGYAIHLATERFMDGEATLDSVLDSLERFFDEKGLDELDPFHHSGHHPGDFARPRRYEIAAAINRLRTVRMKQTEKSR